MGRQAEISYIYIYIQCCHIPTLKLLFDEVRNIYIYKMRERERGIIFPYLLNLGSPLIVLANRMQQEQD